MIWSQINYRSKFPQKHEHLKRYSVELKFFLEGLFELTLPGGRKILVLSVLKTSLFLPPKKWIGMKQ